MIIFWVAAGALSVAAAWLILRRAALAASSPGPADPALGLYRRQLGEIDDLADRGLLPPGERRSAHAEAARRLLGAAERQAPPWTVQPSARKWALTAAIVTPAAAMAIYLVAGSPGTPDQPFAARLEAWRQADPSTLGAPQMAAVLEALVKARPDDAEARHYLGVAKAAADDPAGAVRALRKAVQLAPDRADLWEALGQASLMQAGGAASPQAQVAFREALERNPKAMIARFHLARAQIAAGDRAGGLAAWRGMLAEMSPDDPSRAQLQAAIAQVEGGPAAAAAPPQLAAIRGMVESLAARLRLQPDDAEGWVRLVRSYAVLGETAKRDEALKAARARYAGKPEILDALRAAAAAEPLR